MGGSEHIVMVPFMAHGHLIPFLSLAQRLHHRTGFRVTLATTPLNVKYLTSCIDTAGDDSAAANQSIRLVALPFSCADNGLPPNSENTEALPLHHMITIIRSTHSLKEPFRDLIADITAGDGKPPLCIISDVFIGWGSEVARACGTVNVSFTTSGAYGTTAYNSFWRNLPHLSAAGADGEGEFSIPGFPDSCRFNLSHLHPYMRAADGTDPWSNVIQSFVSDSLDSFGSLCNTVEEIEPLGSEALRSFTKLPVWCVGPLIPPAMLKDGPGSLDIAGKRTGKVHGLSPEKCREWLDEQSEGSVLYISFGSQNTISASQMMELGLGLKDSGKAFIWVIRPPIGFDIKGEFKSEWLPEGFLEENQAERRGPKQGLVIHGWAPQLEILWHKSTGAFLSHCGWNSSLESLSQGVPLIGWPMAGEQAFNSKMMAEELGVCIELTKGVKSNIARSDVKRVIDIVLCSKEMTEKAGRVKDLIRVAVKEENAAADGGGKGSSLRAIDDFVSALLSRRRVPV
ncbi:unnamed protein product [Cuscuta epithymum]|uniref:Glycosyltransferase n=1 Tax=Cuscuta epithymum TaxID=186058 RepID=A0AAV0C906_9ASTE|nr:unnamed protein product [Cuscuta epithymum]CAH9138991.1 unnamed protein product [Cuscuta epithymum]